MQMQVQTVMVSSLLKPFSSFKKFEKTDRHKAFSRLQLWVGLSKLVGLPPGVKLLQESGYCPDSTRLPPFESGDYRVWSRATNLSQSTEIWMVGLPIIRFLDGALVFWDKDLTVQITHALYTVGGCDSLSRKARQGLCMSLLWRSSLFMYVILRACSHWMVRRGEKA